MRRYSNAAAAEHVEVAVSTWRSYVSRGQAPPPDGVDESFGRPYWLKSTLDKWKATHGPRPGGRPRKQQQP